MEAKGQKKGKGDEIKKGYLLTQMLGEKKAFTLIETALAVGLSAILATSVAPMFTDAPTQAQISSENMVTGNVQTGITLKQMENLATRGVPTFPPTLDTAPVGVLANTSNPFFHQVLQFPVTTGWRKESFLSYRSPTGRLFVYDPETGTFSGEGGPSPPRATKNFGDIAFEFGGIIFYKNGSIVDTTSSLTFEPHALNNRSDLTLASGTKISTLEDDSAVVQVFNGETLSVADIKKSSYFKLKLTSKDPAEKLYGTFSAGGKEFGEGTETKIYKKKEERSDANGGSYYYEYDINKEYSSGSLKKEGATIYRNKYTTPVAQTSEGSWTTKKNGDKIGKTRETYNYDTESRYGESKGGKKQPYAHQQTGKKEGWDETEYTYEKEKGIWNKKLKGHHREEADRETKKGKEKKVEEYDYEGTSLYDKKNETYKSEIRYVYKDGRDLTRRYEYNDKEETTKSSVTDNKTGKVTR